MKFASVILDIPTQSLDTPYTYIIPDKLPHDEFDVNVGCAVVVPFQARFRIGFVISLEELPDGEYPKGLPRNTLKEISSVISPPFFNNFHAECALYLANTYLAPLAPCIHLFIPPGSIPRIKMHKDKTYDVIRPIVCEAVERWVVQGTHFDEYTPRKGAVKQIAIYDALRSGDIRVAELTARLGHISNTLNTLVEKRVVSIEHRKRILGDQQGFSAVTSPAFSRFKLTAGQTRALKGIMDAYHRHNGEVILLDGVTGSGKTEVYLRAIEEVFAEGRCACVLVPEISLTPQTVARFHARFGKTVALIHSRMSQRERYDQWEFIKSGKAQIVVGARSALFSPLENIGLFVIDEEHDESYKQDSAPRYHARDVAVWMAERLGATVVLGSATPSLNTMYRTATKESWHRILLPERTNDLPLPKVTVIDMTEEFSRGNRSMFSLQLQNSLKQELENERKAVLLLNQRGFAKFLLCRNCGFVPKCDSCSTSLTYHERGNLLMCHHCGFHTDALSVCPLCSSPYLKKFGAGTQRVEDELKALLVRFAGNASLAQVIRMDADTTKTKGSHAKLLEDFASARSAVLLGTQMIAKGLDFKDVTLVGVINADTQLNLPDYRAGERTFNLIEQVAGRAGRAELKGKVYVQTYNPQATPIQSAAVYDRKRFLNEELLKRKLLAYPPYVRMANLLVWGRDEKEVSHYAKNLEISLHTYLEDFATSSWEVLPATPCILLKLRKTYRWHIVIKIPPDQDFSCCLKSFMRKRKVHEGIRVALDIDPESLL